MNNDKNWSIKILAEILLLSFILCGCAHDNDNAVDYKSVGIITGPDYKMCPCCGGWEITINNQSYHFESLPNNSGIDLGKEIFPLKVKLNWEIKNVCKWITVTQIAKADV